ncbi:MAG: hypothetical protein IJO48_00745 [Clostridia bacterium]|nr:hypothetical protein [Clostridia bacterium]
MFCKKCGTLYNPKEGPCPKCSTADIKYEPKEMSEEEAAHLRKKSWIQLLIGIPAFIGFIYLTIYLMDLIKS